MVTQGGRGMTMIDLSVLNTEQNNLNTRDIDVISTKEILEKINQEDKTVAYVIEQKLDAITTIVEATYQSLKQGGRLIYLGAGTSGRLGVLDAAECPPTYGVSSELVIGLIAGGESAMFLAKEGGEDSTTQSIEDLKHIQLSEKDTVIGLAASGRTPYVVSGLEYANAIGATTCSISCVERAKISQIAKYPVELVTGAEVITGSTRMKAGTAQKLVLNMISTTVMIKLGKVYQNYMVDVKPTNSKLVRRAINMIATLTQLSNEEAEKLFEDSGRNVKVALVMSLLKVNKNEAIQHLNDASGKISNIIHV